MDRKTLQAFVIDSRKKGMTFENMAETLRNEYGIVRNRQSLHGIYKRAITNKEREASSEKISMIADVVNIYALGYNMAETRNIACNIGNDVSYYNVRDIISKEQEYIESVKNTMVFKTVRLILEGKSSESMVEELTYKGIKPTENGLKSILIDSYSMIVLSAATNELVKAYRDVEDRDIIRKVIEKTGLDIEIQDIKNRA